ncbi:MAG: 1-acyl-sn-glycerol-3-phosphate acyltransferase [Oscillospiraceae bacterium]|nr:1-acyl-sn-glycerol-3-phosphate acyltransferase [Oscillospiraceae bacterium]
MSSPASNRMYRTIRFVCKPLFTVLYRPKIIGAENIPERGGAALAGNHMHALDPILIDVSTRRIVRTLAKSELFEGFWGFIFRGVAAIPVDLHAKKNPAALNAATEALKNGALINLSPEAKRNYTEYLLLPFKYGAVSMADKTKAPIIPYAIAGRYKPFGGLTVKFGKPFYTTGDLRDDNKRLYEEITRLLLEISPNTQKIARSFEEWEEAD